MDIPEFMAVWSSFLNCCCHHSLLVPRNGDSAYNILHSWEGVTQRGSLDVFAYVIGVLTLIKCLKASYPDVTQHWYANDAGALGTFNNMGLIKTQLTGEGV